jgi:hypothetical protein
MLMLVALIHASAAPAVTAWLSMNVLLNPEPLVALI